MFKKGMRTILLTVLLIFGTILTARVLPYSQNLMIPVMLVNGFIFGLMLVQAANVDVSLELIFTALGKDDFFKKRTVEAVGEQVSLKEHYTYSAVYFLLLFLFVPAGLRVLSLKEQGIPDRLKTMQVSSVGVFLGLGIPGFLVSVVFLAALCMAGGNPGGFLPALCLVIPWLIIFEMLGYFCKDSNRYLFICSILIVCLAVLGGSLIPEVYLPDGFRAIAEILPNRNFTLVMGGVAG